MEASRTHMLQRGIGRRGLLKLGMGRRAKKKETRDRNIMLRLFGKS